MLIPHVYPTEVFQTDVNHYAKIHILSQLEEENKEEELSSIDCLIPRIEVRLCIFRVPARSSEFVHSPLCAEVYPTMS